MFLAALLLTPHPITKYFKIDEPAKDETYYSEEDYQVDFRTGQLRIQPARGSVLLGPNPKHNYKSEDLVRIYDQGVICEVAPEEGTPYKNGWLHGFDWGEWKGTLTYFEKGARKPQEILRDNIKAFGESGSGLVILTGLAHLGMAETEIYRATRAGEKWDVKRIATPPVVPGIAYWNGQHFLVGGSGPAATSVSLLPASDLINGIYKLGLDGKMAIITSFPFHKYRINSMVEDTNGTIWLGGLRMIAQLQPNKDRTRYACSIFVRKNYGRPN